MKRKIDLQLLVRDFDPAIDLPYLKKINDEKKKREKAKDTISEDRDR